MRKMELISPRIARLRRGEPVLPRPAGTPFQCAGVVPERERRGDWRSDGRIVMRMRGVTLIELLVVVAVIGILASIAVPSYQQYVRNAARADAKSVLLDGAQFLERNFTEANRYDETSGGEAVSLPNTQSPTDGDAKYAITLTATETTFLISATPAEGSMMQDDACGTLTLNQLGQKGVSNATLESAQCWNK